MTDVSRFPGRETGGRLQKLRVLLSEGSSTSARETVTILGAHGHHVEICDPDPFCIARFSRHVRRFHRCPGLGVDPEGYVAFVTELVARRPFDVLLPIHEQGLALCTVIEQLGKHVGVALPEFAAYERVHSKAGFSRLLDDLGLPQPRTQFIETPQQAGRIDEFPVVLKSAIGTASRGVWIVPDARELRRAIAELERRRAFEDVVLAQEWIDAPVEHAQAVFSHGRLLGMTANRQVLRGAGGGDAMKESVLRPAVRSHLARIGVRLGWHGALSVDYLLAKDGREPLYIDCNPRLVEPFLGILSGQDLLTLLLLVSLERPPPPLPEGVPGVRAHMALQVLLECAARTHSRKELARQALRLALAREPFSNSQEELTPVAWDWPSIVPLAIGAAWLAIDPEAAHDMPGRRWGGHLLNPESIRRIREKLARPIP
jgi:hypothetical protein